MTWTWEDHGRPTFLWLYHMLGPTLALMPALALMFWARWRLRSAWGRASGGEVGEDNGARVASMILEASGRSAVAVVPASGPLADYYDAPRLEVRLSPRAFQGRSLAALAVAAHEAGHALQPRWVAAFRTALVFGSRLAAIAGWMAFAAGFAMDYVGLVNLGDRSLTAAVASAFALLPIGLDANRRALSTGALGAIASDPAFLAALRAAPLAHVAALLPFGRGGPS
jgi:Zn-dependent membrane protease YugP